MTELTSTDVTEMIIMKSLNLLMLHSYTLVQQTKYKESWCGNLDGWITMKHLVRAAQSCPEDPELVQLVINYQDN